MKPQHAFATNYPKEKNNYAQKTFVLNPTAD